MNRTTTLRTAVIVVALAGSAWVARLARQPVFAVAADASIPTFEVDPIWPKLPINWLVAQVAGVAVDSHDHIWILNRPQMMSTGELRAATNPPTAECCVKNPTIMEFDIAGNYIQGWGGPGAGYDWPDVEHGIHIDAQDNVWIGGSGLGIDGAGKLTGRQKDHQILKFTRTGKFLMQIGKPGESQGSNDTKNLNKPAGIAVWAPTNEVFVADGYQNRRVIVFDAATGAYKRHWGAYGNKPDDAAPNKLTPNGPPPQQFNTVHGLAISKDGIVYVGDRGNNRIQAFTLAGKFLKEVFLARNTGGPGTAFDAAFSADPQQQFLYVPDGTNNKIWILDRRSLAILGSFGKMGRNSGQFDEAHSIAADSKGNIYTGEAVTGRRAQKFVFKGMKPAAPH